MKEKPIDLYDEIRKFMNVTTRYIRKTQDVPVKREITHSQALMLTYIYENQSDGKFVYQKDIENHFMIRRSTATEMLKKLERLGYLKREQSKKDARLKDLHLTEKTITLIKSTQKDIKNIGDVVGKGITSEERQVIKSVILKMKANILKELKNEENS